MGPVSAEDEGRTIVREYESARPKVSDGRRRGSKPEPPPRPVPLEQAREPRRMPKQWAKRCRRPAPRKVPVARRPADRPNCESTTRPARPPPDPPTWRICGRRWRLQVLCGSADIPSRPNRPASNPPEPSSHNEDKRDSPRSTSPLKNKKDSANPQTAKANQVASENSTRRRMGSMRSAITRTRSPRRQTRVCPPRPEMMA